MTSVLYLKTQTVLKTAFKTKPSCFPSSLQGENWAAYRNITQRLPFSNNFHTLQLPTRAAPVQKLGGGGAHGNDNVQAWFCGFAQYIQLAAFKGVWLLYDNAPPLANVGQIFWLNSALQFSGDLWVKGKPELAQTANVNQLGLTESAAPTFPFLTPTPMFP